MRWTRGLWRMANELSIGRGTINFLRRNTVSSLLEVFAEEMVLVCDVVEDAQGLHQLHPVISTMALAETAGGYLEQSPRLEVLSPFPHPEKLLSP